MAKISVVKIRQFIAAVVALVLGVIIIAFALKAAGLDVPGFSAITDAFGF